jgi:hypothetical protein
LQTVALVRKDEDEETTNPDRVGSAFNYVISYSLIKLSLGVIEWATHSRKLNTNALAVN